MEIILATDSCLCDRWGFELGLVARTPHPRNLVIKQEKYDLKKQKTASESLPGGFYQVDQGLFYM